ncbi:uncharacterized protein IUM83_12300 [Phytophthora cinnamomi]|uniref:uncharacterized protein n=1 Tax=Phytophthora cinnamomi TaxID=4785 RepID=UPI00355AA051|nr:hypothetical protein IUM83_12300 [Phytophthora cinnamomi]
MTALALRDATALVAAYVARASSDAADRAVCSPCRLVRGGFGAAVGRSWPLSPGESWVRLDVVTMSQMNVPLPQTDRPSLAQQLRTRRALLELVCQLSATPSCRWEESFEALWWPALLRPADFTPDKYLETVRDVGAAPRFALAVGRPTLEGVQMIFQFLQMDPRGLLAEEDRLLIERLRVSGCVRQRRRVEICLRLSNNVVDTSVLRSMVDGLRWDIFPKVDTSTKEEEGEEEEEEGGFRCVEFEVTSLWFDNCRFLSAAEDLKLLAQLVTLPSSTIRNLMLPGVYFNSLRNPAGLQSFKSFARQVLAPSSPLRALDLTRVGIDGNCMAALCSALRYSSPLTKLSVGYTTRGAHSNSRLLWAWIFLAVFHVDSGSELEHFDVSGLQLQAQDVEALVAMLESPHPGRTLVLLQDGRLPEGEGCEECELPPNERLFVRLLDGSQAWASPGYSAAWPQLLPGTLQAMVLAGSLEVLYGTKPQSHRTWRERPWQQHVPGCGL